MEIEAAIALTSWFVDYIAKLGGGYTGKGIILIDAEELAQDIFHNIGNYQFVMSKQGELFDCSSTASPDDLRLLLPVVPQTTLPDDKDNVAASLANEFFLALNLDSTWQGQAVDGKSVTDIFEFIEIQF